MGPHGPANYLLTFVETIMPSYTQTDLFGNHTTVKTELNVSQLSLFSAQDDLDLAMAAKYERPIEEITDRLTAAMIGKKYVTALGLAFGTALTEHEVFMGLTTLKLGGKIAVTITPSRPDEELYSLA